MNEQKWPRVRTVCCAIDGLQIFICASLAGILVESGERVLAAGFVLLAGGFWLALWRDSKLDY